MIKTLRTIVSKSVSPYENMALEEYLLHNLSIDECILYLWRNEKTIVIGRNQNTFKECKVAEFCANGGRIVRRLSGGGAVFHDLGNLNFTFLVKKKDLDVTKQLEVVRQAVLKFDIHAVLSGRNDLTVDGKKFSGNAFFSSGENCYHHGTILIQADMSNMARYLTASTSKMQSKGVDSVRSRVINLVEQNPSITTHKMENSMLEAFSEVYGLTPTTILATEIDEEEHAKLTAKFSLEEWIFSKQPDFTWNDEKRFSWGEICIRLLVERGQIQKASVFSDALDTDFILALPEYLKGILFIPSVIEKAFAAMPIYDLDQEKIKADVLGLFRRA